MSINTRERLLDVARQLIVRKGIENTTMCDIANASDKGRRTLYTYFKSKREIYDAVIERESESRLKELESVIAMDLPADRKLYMFLMKRCEIINSYICTPSSAGYLRALFTSELKRIERVRTRLQVRQKEMMDCIIADGLKSGIFDRGQCARLESMLDVLIRGIDVVYVNNRHTGHNKVVVPDGFEPTIVEFIVNAIKIRN